MSTAKVRHETERVLVRFLHELQEHMCTMNFNLLSRHHQDMVQSLFEKTADTIVALQHRSPNPDTVEKGVMSQGSETPRSNLAARQRDSPEAVAPSSDESAKSERPAPAHDHGPTMRSWVKPKRPWEEPAPAQGQPRQHEHHWTSATVRGVQVEACDCGMFRPYGGGTPYRLQPEQPREGGRP